jgi:capsular polysaccharide transport system ATP-binding protein
MAAEQIIRLFGVSKDYHSRSTHVVRRVLNDVTFNVSPGEKIAVLGHNGAGKSTLIRLISGIEVPTVGTIERSMSVSWPVGLEGGMSGWMTGNDTIRFISRIYNRPFAGVRDFVDDFAELGTFLAEPVSTYSSGMRGRLNFALSFAIDFDCYLIDEIIVVGDKRFQQRSFDEIYRKRTTRSLILASHVPSIVREWCSRALVLHRGRAKMFDDLTLATDVYDGL